MAVLPSACDQFVCETESTYRLQVIAATLLRPNYDITGANYIAVKNTTDQQRGATSVGWFE